jgi:cephalosporin-C deacetylase
MPILDKPLPELRTYEGRNPRPADFDGYWHTALAALDATAPEAELIPSTALHTSSADCFDLWFTGVGGARLYAKYMRPKGSTQCPVILQFHGYSGNSGSWLNSLPYAAEGFAIASMDCRGQGGLSEDVGGVKGTTLRGHIIRGLDDPNPQNLLYRSIFLDTVQLARVVAGFPETDADRLCTLGISQGGGLALACAALEPRIRRVASVFPFLCDYQRVWEMDLAKDAYEELRLFFRHHDPRHERTNEIFTRLGYIDCQHLAPRITGSVLMLTGLMDSVCPPSTQFAAYNKITAPKEMVLYPDFGHEGLPDSPDILFNFLGGV